MTTWHRHPSPIGDLLLTGEDGALTGLYTAEHRHAASEPAGERNPAAFAGTCQQLDAYFTGSRRAFDVAIRPAGTPFQQRVWDYLLSIPFGETRTYLDIARFIDSPGAARAVGAANGTNPISIIVPCHRVIAKDGSLQGYAGGTKAKQWLLDHEAKLAGASVFSRFSAKQPSATCS